MYLRRVHGRASETALMVGKSRLFPKDQNLKFSIARKELLALFMGIDLLSQCHSYLTILIDRVYLWVDSVTVIKWCECESKQLSRFVRNPVNKIISVSKGKSPRYVESKNNPADAASRGIDTKHQVAWTLWSQGNSLLQDSGKLWNDDCVKIPERMVQNKDPVEEIKIPAAARFNFVQGSQNKFVEALSKSTTSVEAENGLITIHSCFIALYNEKAKAKGSEFNSQ